MELVPVVVDFRLVLLERLGSVLEYHVLHVVLVQRKGVLALTAASGRCRRWWAPATQQLSLHFNVLFHHFQLNLAVFQRDECLSVQPFLLNKFSIPLSGEFRRTYTVSGAVRAAPLSKTDAILHRFPSCLALLVVALFYQHVLRQIDASGKFVLKRARQVLCLLQFHL